MTSKLIEALKTIANIELYHKEIYEDEDFEGNWTYDETCEYDGLVCEVYKQEIDTIKQCLERLKVVESNSNKVIKDSVALMNRNIELQQLLEIERQAYKNLKELYDIDTKSLLQQNEKLKKAIEILKKYLYLIMDDSGFIINADGYLTQQEYELLKEVLENDITTID